MQHKTWTWHKSAAICCGITGLGLLLDTFMGSVPWEILCWPVNIIVLAALLCSLFLMHILRRRVYAFRYLSTLPAAIPSLAFALVLTLIMGLTRQSADGRWFSNMLSFWPFVLIYLYMTVILGLTTLRRFSHTDIPFLLNHLGLFVALVCATLGNADIRQLRMITTQGAVEQQAFDLDGKVVDAPLAIELQRFIMETYADGSPRRFASDIKVITRDGDSLTATVDVNHPLDIDGWKIYQYGYDTEAGAQSRISILELVRDPWLPFVYAGIFMMLAGALCMLLLKH